LWLFVSGEWCCQEQWLLLLHPPPVTLTSRRSSPRRRRHMYACVLASGVTQVVAVEVKKSRRGVGRWGCVALVLGKDYYCVGIRSVLAWSDNGALLSQGFAAPLFFFAWGNLSLFSVVVVVFFGGAGFFGWSLFHRQHMEDGISTPLCLAACHFESVFFGRCLLPFCTTAWISRIEKQPHNLCCRTWNSKLGNKSESLSLPCFFNLSVSQQMASCCKTLVQQRELNVV